METVQNFVPEGLPVSIQFIGVTILLSIVYSYFTKTRPSPAFPLISVRGLGPRRSWMFHAVEVLREGLETTNGPFQIMSAAGPRILLPNRYADEIRNPPELNFSKTLVNDFPTQYPGFEPHRLGVTDPYLVPDTVRIKLTQSLGLVTKDLVEEVITTVDELFGTNNDWNTRLIRIDMLEIIARASSRVFLGLDLCRNRRWLEVAKTYTVDSFSLTYMMRMVPAIVRPLAYLLLPHSSRIRKSVRDARKLIVPELEKRKAVVDATRATGEKPPKIADSLGWMYDVASSKDVVRSKNVDIVAGQLALVMASIHTSTEGVSRALLDLCKYPEIVQPLRDEIIEVVGREGWEKTTLYKLKLMDSFLKESHRVAPLSTLSMSRIVEKDLILSDGIIIPKDSHISVISDFMNPKTYPEPKKFDVARFLKKRQEPGQENSWQFVTTSPAHLSFGHGEHACPGRFFVSNELKIVLCHLIMKFDWRFVPDEPEPSPQLFESLSSVKPDTRIQARRRKLEFDIDFL
ncbi:cytochrome P450 [Xylaria nigripes]|nr:cytochrome P450 [Xylaria nigripes]